MESFTPEQLEFLKKYFNRPQSVNHHYLPQYYIRGFCNNENKIWVYDIKKDRIRSRTSTPKQIFYEKHRNSIKWWNAEDDVWEFVLNNATENKCGRFFSNLKSIINVSELEKPDTYEIVKEFILYKFFAIPANRELLPVLKAEIFKNEVPKKISDFITHIENNPFIRHDDKSKQIDLMLPLFDIMTTVFTESKNIHWNISKFHYETAFILSDSPFIVNGIPKSFKDFSNKIIYPLSHTLLYLEHPNFEYKKLDEMMVKNINFILTLQSNESFGSSDRVFLEECVLCYRLFSKHKQLYLDRLKNDLFNHIS